MLTCNSAGVKFDSMNLQFDLNEVVSKEIQEEISGLEKQITSLQDQNKKYYSEIEQLKTKVETAKLPIALVTHLRNEFDKITADPKDSNDWHNRKNKNQFLFIEKLMLSLFNIKIEQNGFLSNRGNGNLYHYLAVNYYESKEQLLSVLPLLVNDQYSAQGIGFIKNFKMPKDWSKNEVLAFVKNPGTCTNGSYIGISQFWLERGAGTNNCPYNLVMMNPHISDEDVFEVILNGMKNVYSNYSYFYSLYNYHPFADEQINKLGEMAISTYAQIKSYDNIKDFLKANLNRFNDKILDFLYQYADGDNQFRSLYWENFPVRYQQKFLMEKTMADVLKIITGYQCKWTEDQKQEFLKDYTNQKTNQIS